MASMPGAAAWNGRRLHVEVELEAQAEEEAPLEDARRHLRGADGPQEDGVDVAQLVEDGVGQDLARAQVAVAAEVVVDGVEVDAGRPHDGQGLGHDLRTDPVTTDDSDVVSHANPCFRPSEKRKPPTRGGRSSTRQWGGVRYGSTGIEYRVMPARV